MLFTLLPAFSQPVVNIVQTDTSPVIDGILSEDTWKQAIPVTDLVQREPDSGAPATQATEVYLLYDNNYLYIGVRCYDDPGKVIGREMARGADLSNDDRVQVILDTYLDGRTAYWFQINPAGSINDAIISENGSGFNKDWQGLWEARSSIQSHGWEAEFAIPFKTLNFDPGQSTWGFKFIRYIRRNLESVFWPGSNLNNQRFQVSDAGLLNGLHNISQGVGLDIKPFSTGGHDYQKGADGSIMGDAGADIFYQLSPGLRSVLTINTDFAETEVDDRQVNLTRFGLHFPEKRDFFLDGANYFNFGINGDRYNPYNKRLIPFFSRTLGLNAGGEALPVYAGGRITGQAGKWNLGLMNMFQEEQFGNRNFTAVRVSRNMGKQSSAGMIATLGDVTALGSNALYGLDTRIATSRFAGDKNIAFTAYGLQSLTDRPGEKRNTNNAFGAELSYPNDRLYGRAGFMQIDDDFTAGMGFVPRRGIREYYLMAGAGPRPGKWGILQILTSGSLSHISGINGILQTKEFELIPLDIRFMSGELFTFSSLFSYENLEADFNLLNKIVIPAGEYNFRSDKVTVTSAQQRNLRGSFSFDRGAFYSGTRKTGNIEAGWQVFMHLFIGAEYEKSFLDFAEDGFEVGVTRLTMNWLFSRNVNLYNFIQHDDISETLGWQSRFQWIISPGREILLAWNSNVNDPLERFTIAESSLRFKVKYNIRF